MSRANNEYIRTFSGRKFWALDPRPEDIELIDIAHALSNNCRWGGHCGPFYSVAEHSVLTAALLPRHLQLAGLLHDASEAYLIDLPRPIKYQIPQYREIEHKLMLCIAEKYGFEYPLTETVKGADDFMLYYERATLFPQYPESIAADVLTDAALEFFFDQQLDGDNLPIEIKRWSPSEARTNFIMAFSNGFRSRREQYAQICAEYALPD